LTKLVKNQDSGLQDIGVQHLSQLLRTQRSKELFWKQKADTVGPLFDILRKGVGAAKDNDSTLWSGNASIRSSDTKFAGGVGLQLMYHVLLVIWQLSFEGELVGDGLEKYACTVDFEGKADVYQGRGDCTSLYPTFTNVAKGEDHTAAVRNIEQFAVDEQGHVGCGGDYS
jgi:hypothetical protein